MEAKELAKAIGQRIKSIREESDLSQTELAERAGISVYTLREWEQGKKIPTFPNGVRLANALQVSANDLLPSEEESTEEA